MDELEQQIKAWADASAPATGESVDAADVIDGRVGGTTVVPIGARTGGRRWLAVAAAVVVIGAIGIGLAVGAGDDGPDRLQLQDTTTTEPQTSQPVGPTDVAFEELGVSQVTAGRIGRLETAQTDEELATLWAYAALDPPVAKIDFDRQVVVSMTIADDACPPKLTAFVRNADMVEPRFLEPQEVCEQPLVGRTYVAALDWEDTGDEFLLVLNGTRVEDDQESLLVTRASTVDEGGDDEVGEPAAGVTASLDLESTEAAVGGTVTGTVTVDNRSGAPIDGTTCGDYFVGALGNAEFQQGVFRNACLGPFTIPEGISTYPIEVDVAVNGCTPAEVDDQPEGPPVCNADGSMPAFSPGEYQLTIDDPQHLVPALDPVTITVT